MDNGRRPTQDELMAIVIGTIVVGLLSLAGWGVYCSQSWFAREAEARAQVVESLAGRPVVEITEILAAYDGQRVKTRDELRADLAKETLYRKNRQIENVMQMNWTTADEKTRLVKAIRESFGEPTE